jgi:micrococcal nuclease
MEVSPILHAHAILSSFRQLTMLEVRILVSLGQTRYSPPQLMGNDMDELKKAARFPVVTHFFGAALAIVLAADGSWSAEPPRDQPRVHGVRVSVPLDRIRIDDGDTIEIPWDGEAVEVVRILGIDAPETRHVDHDIPFDQPFGPEATAFTRGVFSMTERVELLRSSTLDPYDRTLGYVFVNGRNFSVLIIEARLAVETISVFGDNGLPNEAAACVKASAEAGPVPFESPHLYRRRMREVAQQMRAEGLLPAKQ